MMLGMQMTSMQFYACQRLSTAVHAAFEMLRQVLTLEVMVEINHRDNLV